MTTDQLRQDAQAVPQGWQPIETAPKDGTVIDLWHEEFGREADCYWGLPHHCCGEMGSLCDSDWHSLEPGWVGTFNEIMSPANAYTHWMPLPPAPDADPTPPAQQPEVRQWAGLTDVGIATAMISAGDPPEQSSEGFIQWCEKFADAIEANLKERNA